MTEQLRTHGGLYEGIGGFSLAAEAIHGGYRSSWHVEIDPFCIELDERDGRRVGSSLNPTWVEWLMGYPLGYTEIA